MSLLYINYTQETKIAYLEFRVFGDDLALAVEQELGERIDVEELSEHEKKVLNEFIKSHLKIKLGRNQLNLDFHEYNYKPGSKLLTLKYQFPSIVLNKGEKVIISNDLFFKQWPTAQSNWYELVIPNVVKTTIQCHSPDSCVKTYNVR